MHIYIPRAFLTTAAAALAVVAIVFGACTTGAPTTAVPIAPVTVQQQVAPQVPQAGAQAPGAPPPGPNLLAKDWASHLGVIVSDLQPATGKPVITPKPGDLYFFSNSSTAWGATNLTNAVWVIDAKSKATVAEVAPFDGKGNASHGLAVSGDGKYIYLPQLGADNHIDVLDGRTFEVVQTIKTLGRAHHWKLFHDPNTNKDLILGEDFNWNFTGSGVYVFDPSQKNAVVGGLSNGDIQGNPYVTTPSPDGSFIIVTSPATFSGFRDKMDGLVAKIDTKTWKVLGITPMVDPLWAEVSLDGKFAYVTSGGMARLYKIDLATMKIVSEVQTGPGPWGARLSYDQTKVYTADKGEGPGYNQQGRTSTIIDLATMGVTNVVPIGLTTDHALLSPDGKEIWYTSNAEHSIYVLDTATEKITQVIKDPADGDIHGGVWVQYKDDGKGGVTGEVVADYAGLHGSALKAEQDYVKQPAVTIALDRNGFLQKELSIPVGQKTRLSIKNVAGTNGGNLTFESKDLGVASITLGPGRFTEATFTAPAQPTTLKATTSAAPNKELTIKIVAAAQPQSQGQTQPVGPREIKITSLNYVLDVTSIDVKAGETVKFTFVNRDDEKHNLVGIGGGNLLSPDFAGGSTGSYTWTAPTTPQAIKVVCAYHPIVTFQLNVK